jgi:cytochrome c553
MQTSTSVITVCSECDNGKEKREKQDGWPSLVGWAGYFINQLHTRYSLPIK